MKVEARVIYPVIRSLNSGLYVWASLVEESILEISKLKCSVVKPELFEWEYSTELHATIVYHPGELPAHPAIPPDQNMVGVVQNVLGWNDHKGKQIVVAQLYSPDLVRIHNEFRAQGFVHSFPEYVPHITLGKFVEPVSLFEFRIFVQRLNDILYRYPIRINFQPKLFGDSLC